VRWSTKHQHFHDEHVVPGSTSVSRNEEALQSQNATFTANVAAATTRVTDEPISVAERSTAGEDQRTEDLRARPQTVPITTNSSLAQDGEASMPWRRDHLDGPWGSHERAHFATCLISPSMHHDQPDFASERAIAFDGRACRVDAEDYTIFRNPVDVPTALIEYWFSQVCEMWSTFDSEVNRNRQIAYNTWTTSEAVFCTLQAMSASCLMDSMPLLHSSLPFLLSQALGVIDQRMLVLRSLPNAGAGVVAIDLVFAVFALGTSFHWAEPSQLGDSLLMDARNLLGLWESSSNSPDTLLRAYFQQALIYWDMLHSIVDSDCGNVKLDGRRRKFQNRLHEAMGIGGGVASDHITHSQLPESLEALWGTRPNSWCGLSSEVIDVFGQTLALYRSARIRHRQGVFNAIAATCDAVCDFGIAHELLRELLGMNFDDTVRSDQLLGFTLHTYDHKTPLSHLKLIAEAYQLASLLQLYLAFDDLELEPLMSLAYSTGGNSVGTREDVRSDKTSRPETIAILALKLIKILEQIPAQSGSRCMQPVLYISAAAALKCGTDSAPENYLQATNTVAGVSLDEYASSTSVQPGGCHLPCFRGSQLDQASFDYLGSLQSTTPPITQASLEIAKARHFVMKRLGLLQQTLPSRPIGVALKLVKAIWATYDSDSLGLNQLHWPDIMIDTGLQTLFR